MKLLLLSVLCVSALSTATQILPTNKTCTLPWHTIDPDSGDCICYNSLSKNAVKCYNSGRKISVLFGSCLTMDENYSYLGPCLNDYPSIVYPNIDHRDPRYLILQANHTTINAEMCGELDRTGPYCSRCREGYGASVLHAGFAVCGKCEWYGIPVYLMLEFGPLTLLFVVLLVFPITLTSAPMSSFVVFCQIVSSIVTYSVRTVPQAIVSSGQPHATVFYLLFTASGIWNLDFTTYLGFIPPICISSKLTNIHIVLLKYLSAAYPLFLTVIAYICVQLHARGNKTMVALWRPFHKCFSRAKQVWDPKKSLVDVFASFILLSYSKLFLLFFLSLSSTNVLRVPLNEPAETNKTIYLRLLRFDSTVPYLTGKHIPIALFSLVVLVLFTVLPVLLLCCYTLKCFRRGLNACRLTKNRVALNIFVEKFQADYCDGLNGHKYDLRSFSSMNMTVLSFAYISMFLIVSNYRLAWFLYASFLLAATVVVFVVKPHKKAYMTAVTGSLLGLLVFYALLFNTFINNLRDDYGTVTRLLTIWIGLLTFAIPQVVFYSYLLYKPVKKCYTKLKSYKVTRFRIKSHTQEATNEEKEDDEEPHRLQNPTEYSPLLNHSHVSINKERRSLSDRDTY